MALLLPFGLLPSRVAPAQRLSARCVPPPWGARPARLSHSAPLRASTESRRDGTERTTNPAASPRGHHSSATAARPPLCAAPRVGGCRSRCVEVRNCGKSGRAWGHCEAHSASATTLTHSPPCRPGLCRQGQAARTRDGAWYLHHAAVRARRPPCSWRPPWMMSHLLSADRRAWWRGVEEQPF